MNRWNKVDVFEDEVMPLMRQIIEICQRERLPLLFSMQYASADGSAGNNFCTIATAREAMEPVMRNAYRELMVQQPEQLAIRKNGAVS